MPDDKPDLIGQMVKDMRGTYREAHSKQRSKWAALSAIYDGTYTKKLRSLPWKTRYKSNDMWAILQQAKAIAVSRLPVPRAISDIESELPMGMCDTANAALDSWASAIDYERLADGIQDDCGVFGCGFVKFTIGGKNKVNAEIVNPLNLWPHPLATSLSDCEAIGEDIVLPLSAALRRWPEHAPALWSAARATGSVGLDASGETTYAYETPNDYDATTGAVSPGRDLNMPVLLFQVFMKDSTVVDVMETEYVSTGEVHEDGSPVMEPKLPPKKKSKYPNGRMIITTCQGTTIVDEANYDPQGLFPYVMFGSYWKSHEFWPTSDAEMMASTALHSDQIISILLDVAKAMAYPSYAVKRGQVQRDLLIYRPGQHIPVNDPTRDIRPLAQPPMHDATIMVHTILDGKMKFASNTPDELRGQRPRGDVTGASIEKMTALATLRPTMKQRNFERAMGELFSRAYEYMKQEYDDGRQLYVNPRPGDITMRRVMSGPVQPNTPTLFGSRKYTWNRKAMKDAAIRIIVEPGSSMPVDEETQYTGLMSMIQALAALYASPVNPSQGIDIARRILPPSYLLAHAPIRDKQMIMERAYAEEREMGFQQGMQKGAEQAMSQMSMEEIQALQYGRAMGSPGGVSGNGSPM